MIRIRVAILDKDEIYTGRLINAFNTYYQDKLEAYSFTETDIALDFLQNNKIDVLLVDESIDIKSLKIPQNCAYAYLTVMNSVDSIGDVTAICKYMKVDLIYKEILSVFSEGSQYSIVTGNQDGNATPVSLFVSAAGGTGASSVAAAYATYKARSGFKPLLINLERFGGAGCFFQGEGNMNLSDIIFALKSKKANLALKLESSVKVSPNGVCFIDTANLVLDVMELKDDDIINLINEACSMQSFDEIIVDIGFSMKELDFTLIEKASKVILVSDGSEIANAKTVRCIESMQILDQQKEKNLVGKISLFYNRFSSRLGKRIENLNVNTIGGVPRIEGSVSQIIDSIAGNSDLQKI